MTDSMEIAAGSRGHRNSPLAHAALAVVPVVATAALGSWATLPNVPTWYAGLAKPPVTPPNGAFGPAWTFLYGLMAYAVWRVLSAPPSTPGRDRAVALFFVQLALNAAWSWSFFAAHSPGAGLVNILLLDAAVAATIVAVRQVDNVAGLVMVPYFLWIAYATYLNAGIWLLNG